MVFPRSVQFGPDSEIPLEKTTSLIKICIKGIICLLDKKYWSKTIEKHNPFSALPCTLVEQLLDAAVLEQRTLSLPYLYPLITSGKVKKFCLSEGVSIECNQFIRILNTLSDHALQLSVLILKNIISNDEDLPDEENETESAIDRILLSSPNLESIQTHLSFDLKCIQKIHTLKKLELEYGSRGSLCDMVPKIADTYITNDTMTHFTYSWEQDRLDELVFILQHWIGLTHVKTNIAHALEHCHGHEFANGTLTKRYKLQDIELGLDSQCVSSVISIAALTCPDIRNLRLFLEVGSITALCNFQNLEVLNIQYPKKFVEDILESTGNFEGDLKLVVESIGVNLKRLEMNGIRNIDLSIIGRFCQNLSHLDICEGSVVISDEVPCFEHLEHLTLEFSNPADVTKETILQFVPQCKIVSTIEFSIACLDDDLLKKLLSLKVWPELKSATFDSSTISKTMGELLHKYSPSSYITIYYGGCCCCSD